ncbi:MAG TPA: hypothetical protein VLM17_00410 [Xanthomonadaceae bacterium]|nr:hypothetical protein [Xanthomonadaceae bacterium]
MQRAATLALLAIAIGTAATGCKREAPAGGNEPAATATAATTPGAQAPPPAATQPPASAENGMPSAAQSGMPATENGFDLDVAESADHGKYIVDGTGKTVYMLAKDNGTTSTCQNACATEWPPLLAQGEPKTMDPELSDGDIGVIQRGDGTQQVTFAGHPLYHYARDTAAGQLNGAGKHDEFGDWSLLSPEGKPLAAK